MGTTTNIIRRSRFAIIAGAIAILMAVLLSVGGAYAYFTTYAKAQGGAIIEMGTTTKINEEFDNWTKSVTIQNTGDGPCFVRVRPFASDEHPLTITGEGWYYGDNMGNRGYTGADGWWYYEGMLDPGALTTTLAIKIAQPTDEQTEPFNVVVIHESTIVSNADGTGGDWSVISDSGSTTNGVETRPTGN